MKKTNKRKFKLSKFITDYINLHQDLSFETLFNIQEISQKDSNVIKNKSYRHISELRKEIQEDEQNLILDKIERKIEELEDMIYLHKRSYNDLKYTFLMILDEENIDLEKYICNEKDDFKDELKMFLRKYKIENIINND